MSENSFLEFNLLRKIRIFQRFNKLTNTVFEYCQILLKEVWTMDSSAMNCSVPDVLELQSKIFIIRSFFLEISDRKPKY